jgi:hypothetical protein
MPTRRANGPSEPVTVVVDPRDLFCPSGISVVPGARYRFEAEGKWKDWWIRCGPEGWPGLVLEGGNRLPWRRTFLLCASVGKDLQRAFPVGPGCNWTAPAEAAEWADQQLYFFANDWPGKYDNNHPLPPSEGGPMRVRVTRLS